jgi:maleate isomerase
MTFMTPQITMGWRARIGVLTPEHGYLDEDTWAYVPPGVALMVSRTRMQSDDTVPSITKNAEDPELDRAAWGFRRINVDSVVYVCTAVGFIRGPEGDTDLNHRMSDAAQAPATCAITASVEAMRALGLRRISVGSPYSGEIQERLLGFLEYSGFEVNAQRGLNLVGVIDGAAVCETSLESIRRLAHAVDRPDSEGIYLGCTALRSAEIVEALEQDLGKPVVMATQASMWHALELAGVHANQQGLGSLFSRRLAKTDRVGSEDRALSAVG